MQIKKLLLLVLVVFVNRITAQNINAPYSTYGVGDINTRFHDRSSGMGYTSLALSSTAGFLLTKNPASITGLDRSVLQVDLSLVGKSVNYIGNPITTIDNNSLDMAIKRMAVSIKLNNHWAGSISLSPFSYVNYLYTATKNIEGTATSYNAQYEGDGGLYHIAWNNAYSIGKHFSTGIRSSFIFGSINQTETLQRESADPVESKTRNYYNNVRFEYGALYKGRLNKNWQLSLGGTIATKTTLSSERTLTVTEGINTIEKDKVLTSTPFRLPNSYSAGIAVINRERNTFTVDYTYENWGDLQSGGNSWSLINSHRLSAGIQFVNKTEQWGRIFEKSFFQAGFYSEQSYLRVRNTPVTEVGGTLGYGGFLSGTLAYTLSLDAGRRGTTTNGLIKENFVQFTLALSYREFLFSKGRKYN